MTERTDADKGLRGSGPGMQRRQVLSVRVLNGLSLAKAGRGVMIPCLILLSACAPGRVRVAMPGSIASRTTRIPATVRVQVHEAGALVVRDVSLEQYVETTILSEMHPDVADARVAEPLFEVQAIIARTYAVANAGRHAKDGFDLCATTHCQLYDPAQLQTSRWAPAAHDAVRRTAGELLWFADQPAQVVFHADCGGHTSDAAAVWGGSAVPYLVGAPDSCATEHSAWTFDARESALRAALNADTRTNVGATLDRVEVAGRDGAGRAELITLRGARTFVIRGEVFRDVVTRAFGMKSLKSTLFSVTRTGDRFVFAGRGFGHGVGLPGGGGGTGSRRGVAEG